MTPISFFVSGIPKPAGSKRGFYVQKLKRVVITDANRNSRDWKTDVQEAAKREYLQPFAEPLLTCPLALDVTFYFPRPKSHIGAKGNLRPSAPAHHTTKPDVTKLMRCIEDALNGVIWKDDSQIVSQSVEKMYCESAPGARITISPTN